MTLFPMRDIPKVLLVRTGNLGNRCASLLSKSNVNLTVIEPGSVPAVVSEYGAVALAASRPYPALQRTLDKACWEAGVPWTSAILMAHEFRVGPTVLPGQTPCFDCWSRRVRSLAVDLKAHDIIEALGAVDPRCSWFKGELCVLTEEVAALLAAEVFSLATKTYPLSPNRLGRWWEGDAVFGHLQAHLFARIGLCVRCASGEQKNATWHRLAEYFREKGIEQTI